ncbi:MAG: Flp family type IVb pilin [Candidatus Methylacidiphilales bacterium]|nr:Flp family type IVb pilin [Candidatus Methylacidiphilales bacterium]
MLTPLYTQAVSWFTCLKTRKEGQTLVEYGLILALVAIVVIAVLTVLGRQLRTLFSRVTSVLT